MQDMKVIKGTPCNGCDSMEAEGCFFEHVEREIDAEDVETFRETGRMPCVRGMSNLEFAELSTAHISDAAERERRMEEMAELSHL